jgi:hypothetical protein
LGVEGKNFQVHQLNKASEVLKSASENIGAMGDVNLGGVGFNPAGVMMGMGIGGAMGNQINGLIGNLNQQTPPPLNVSYFIAFNGRQSGPYSLEQLKQLVQNGEFTKKHLVWKEGMTEWEASETNKDVSSLFYKIPPPPPING